MVDASLPLTIGHLAARVMAEVEDASDPGLLPLVAASAIALPMAGVLAFFLWVKVRDRDDPAGPILRPGREDSEESDRRGGLDERDERDGPDEPGRPDAPDQPRESGDPDE